MTPREIELLTIAKLEHDGHQLTPADQREIERTVNADSHAFCRHQMLLQTH
ncbi:hypothetical protein ACKGF3_001437 [Salmonella enterica]|nr:hypothetical protein [Salmonella enterica subsp. enterica serovar Tananarive]ELF8484228.1 hypothetical protein [Salmonella enterica]